MRYWSDKWIGGCLKFLLEAWSLSLHQFARHWASGSVVLRPKQPCIMMTEGLLRQNGQVISISCLVPGLLTYSFCQPWMGSPLHPVTLGEWYGLCGVYCEVIWEETAFCAPAKKRQPPSAHLLAPMSVSPLSALLFLQQDCPHVVTTGNSDNELSRTEPDTQTVFVMAEPGDRLITCHFMRMCQENVGGHEAALFENDCAPFLKGIKVRQKKRIYAK